MTTFDWTPIRYRNVISVLKNPFYAGAYAYGKSVNRTQIVDGRARKTYGHYRSLRDCEVLLKDHHEGYIDWEGLNAIRSTSPPTRVAARMARSPAAAAAPSSPVFWFAAAAAVG